MMRPASIIVKSQLQEPIFAGASKTPLVENYFEDGIGKIKEDL
jgi:hypothetical protein